MVQISYFLNNNLINPPQNHNELAINLNFDKDSKDAIVAINDWSFVRENTQIIQDWITGGLIGAPGIGEGCPFRVELSKGSVNEKIFDGYIDLSDGAGIGKDMTRSRAKERQRIDWLNDVANSINFQYLANKDVQASGTVPSSAWITEDDYVFMPYIVNSIPDYSQSAIMIVSSFVLEQALQKVLIEIQGIIGAIAGSGGLAFWEIVKLILTILYASSLIIAIVKLIFDLVALVIQPVKYHSCMRVVDLLTKGCNYFGLTFKSKLFDENPILKKLVVMPRKFQNPPNDQDNRILGFTISNKSKQTGYPDMNFGEFLQSIKEMFNAKIIINNNNELILARQDYVPGTPLYKLPDIENRNYETNFNRISSNYKINFRYDTTDKNTIQEYEGTSLQSIITPIVTSNQYMVVLKGFTTVSIPYALAKRKTELTFPEKIISASLQVVSAIINALITVVNGFLETYDAIADTINSIVKALKVIGIDLDVNLQPLPKIEKVDFDKVLDKRIDVLKIEYDFTTEQKIFLMDEGSSDKFNKLSAENESVVNALYLWNNYYKVNSYLPTSGNPNGNQYIIRKFENIPFTLEDYLKVKENNHILDYNNNKAKIVSLTWNCEKQTANFEIWFNQLYTSNLKETILLPKAS